jgi:hypothetical protein
MIDEKALRKPTFDESNSAPVVLADGQTWYLPKPWLEVRPTFRGGRAVDSLPALTCGAEFDSLRDAVQTAEGDEIITAGATLAAHMLLLNYDVSDAQLSTLLVFRTEVSWLREAMAIANGATGPKASSAGSD